MSDPFSACPFPLIRDKEDRQLFMKLRDDIYDAIMGLKLDGSPTSQDNKDAVNDAIGELFESKYWWLL